LPNPPALEPADELVLILSRKTLTSEDRERSCRILTAGVDWSRVLNHAADHEVFPLLRRNLADLGFPGVPDLAKGQLEVLYKANALRIEMLSQELGSLLQDANAERLRILPLKGPGLARSLYGDVALRSSVDLDVLVPPDHVPQAMRLLERRGYTREGDDPFFSTVLRRTGIEYVFHRRQGQFTFMVELHWGVLWPPSLDGGAMVALWRDAREGRFLDIPIATLGPEWEFLVLAAHASRHSFQGLKWLVDLYERGIRGDIDWDRVGELAKEAGWEICLERALAACRQMFRSRFGPDPRSIPLPRLKGLYPAPPSTDAQELTLSLLGLMDRPSARLKYVLTVVIMPTLAERRAVKFPRGLEFLYYLLRPLRLGTRWILSVLSRLRGSGEGRARAGRLTS
jgi:hypothetical protein